MEFLMIIAVVVVVLGLVFGYNFLRKKGVIDKNTLDLVDDFLLILKIALKKNKGSNTVKIEKAIEIIRNTIDFIGEQDDMNIHEKKDAALANILESLESIDLEVDTETELLVKLIVNNAFNFVNKNTK